MEIINTKRIWEIFQIIDRIDEDGLLDFNNALFEYEGFLDWFSFKVLNNSIMVFNDDRVPYQLPQLKCVGLQEKVNNH